MCLTLQSLFVCHWLLTDGTVIAVSLIVVVPTVQEKSVFYGNLSAASVSVGLPTQFVHCCLVTARAFMPPSLIVIPYTILEISKLLGQLLVDDDDDDEKCQLNTGIASLRLELLHVLHARNILLTYILNLLKRRYTNCKMRSRCVIAHTALMLELCCCMRKPSVNHISLQI